MKSKTQIWLAVGILFYVLIYWRRLIFEGLVPIHPDTFRFFYPSWAIGKELLESGSFLWDPFRNMGQPFLASPQNHALYPIRFVSILTHYIDYQRISVLFHTLLASTFGYLFFVRWTRNQVAGFLGFFLFGFNGFFLSRSGYITDFTTIAWFPCVLYFFTSKNVVGLAIAMSLQWLAGFPPLFIMTLMFVLFFGLTLKDRKSYFLCFFKSSLLATGLTAFQWIQFLELLSGSIRTVFMDSQSIIYNSVNPIYAIKHLIFPSFMINTSYIYSSSISRFYIGPIIFILFSYGLFKGNRSIKAIGVFSVVCFFLSWGTEIKFYSNIPFISIFRFPSHWLFLLTTAIIVVAGFGFSKIKKIQHKHIVLALVCIDLLIFAWPKYAAMCDLEFLQKRDDSIPQLNAVDQNKRVFHSFDISEKSAGWNWLSPISVQFFKSLMVPSYGTTFQVREAISHYNLHSTRMAHYATQLNQASPDSILFDDANIGKIITLTSKGRLKPSPLHEDIKINENENARNKIYMDNGTPVKVNKDTAGYISVDVNGPGQLVLSEVFHPGWKAKVNGEKRSLDIFKETFIGVKLEEGSHQIEFYYCPPSFIWGGIISLLTIIGILMVSFKSQLQLLIGVRNTYRKKKKGRRKYKAI